MKRLLSILSLALCAYTVSAQQSFTISGKTPTNNVVVINKIENGKPVELAKVTPVNGAFTYKGSVATPEAYLLSTTLTNGSAVRTSLIAEKGAIMVTVSDADNAIFIGGTEANDALQQYNAQQGVFNKEQKALIDTRDVKKKDGTLTDAEEQAMGEKYGKIDEQKNAAAFAFAKTNVNNAAGQYVLGASMTRLPTEQLKEVLAAAGSSAQQTEVVKKATEYVAAVERVAIGQPFVDLRMPSPEGKEVALSDYAGKGKYVLIDFWASWCGPCKKEMPYVVDAYAKYKEKGFEVVGVSLDKDNDSWSNGITKLGITWPQMSDLKFWNSEAVSKYVLTGIPQTILLDPSGKIIAKGLRGEELLKTLGELLNK